MFKLEKSYSLTDEQSKIAQQILFALDNGEKKIIIKGSAGVGKTYMVDYLVNEYRRSIERKGLIYITAPTNKAVSVLMEKNEKPEYYMQYSTIHSALYLKRNINNKTGEITFKPDYNPKKVKPFMGGCIIVVDEASMLNSELLYYLEQAEYMHIPMIFLGDSAQLNPVGEAHSPIFNRKNIGGTTIKVNVQGKEVDHIVPSYIEFEMTEIVRQAQGNPIIHLSRNLHEVGFRQPNLVDSESGIDGKIGYEFSDDYQKCIDLITTQEDTVYLAWTNAAVDKMNIAARNKLFQTPNKLELGETIIFNSPHKGFINEYYTNYVLTIRDLKIKSQLFPIIKGFKYKDDLGKEHEIDIQVDLMYYLVNDDIMIVHESSYKDYINTYRKLKELTKVGLGWRVVYAFIETFAQFSYSYAMTVHKSQGSTYKVVVINKNDLNFNRDKYENKRLWYTAITRAAKKVIIYTPPIYEGRV